VPFTSSHPALILPLAYLPRKYVSMTGLIVGSLMPDFEYFVRWRNWSTLSHTPEGIFLFCLPMGLLTCFIFHNIVRDPFINNLPLFLKARFIKITQIDWNKKFIENWRWLVVAISIVIGAASHVFWDSFTHGPYRPNQLPSTIIGEIIILYVIYKMPRDGSAAAGFSIKYWAAFLLLAAAIMSARVLITKLPFDMGIIGTFIVSWITSSLISITVVSFVWNLRRRKA